MANARPGKRAEQRAVWWYRLRGYRILETNAWVAGYELDIVVRRGRRLIFCEVKEKRGERFAIRWTWWMTKSSDGSDGRRMPGWLGVQRLRGSGSPST